MAGTRPKVLGLEVVEEVVRQIDIELEDMMIHQTMPEDFLLILPNEDTTTRVLNDGKALQGGFVSLCYSRDGRGLLMLHLQLCPD